MNKIEFAITLRKQYPQYANDSDEEILRKVKNAIMQPGAKKIYQFLNQHQVSTGLLSGWFQKRLTAQQAETLESARKAADALNQADMSFLSSRKGVPREKLGDYVTKELEYEHESKMAHGQHDSIVELKSIELNHSKELLTHQTTETIRLEKEKLEFQKQLIDHDVDKKVSLADREAQTELYNASALMKRIDSLIDEIAEFEGLPATKPVAEKIAFKRKALKSMQQDYHERFGK